MERIQIGNCTLFHGDCKEVLGSIDQSKIDAILTDPPYGNDFDCSKKRTRKSEFSKKFNDLADRRWKKIPENDRPFDPSHLIDFPSVIIWGGNFYSSLLPPSQSWLVWDKKCGGTSDNFSDAELAYTNLNGVVRIYHHLWRGMCRKGEENVSRGPKLHPFQKPVALMSWCLSFLPQKTKLVFDGYAGSGSTGIACIRAGISCVLVEKDIEHFNTMRKRVKQEVKQMRLF